jgi:hypothetical protein
MLILERGQFSGFGSKRETCTVDDFEDARFPEFNKAQQHSISGAHLIESECVENEIFDKGRNPTWAQVRSAVPGADFRAAVHSWDWAVRFFTRHDLRLEAGNPERDGLDPAWSASVWIATRPPRSCLFPVTRSTCARTRSRWSLIGFPR